MAQIFNSLPHPKTDTVNYCISKFDQEQAIVEIALTKLFAQYPLNTALDEVLIKVTALNDMYRTSIWATYKVAERIHELDVDPKIRKGEPEIVNAIAQVRLGNKMRNNYSFASKYCAWH